MQFFFGKQRLLNVILNVILIPKYYFFICERKNKNKRRSFTNLFLLKNKDFFVYFVFNSLFGQYNREYIFKKIFDKLCLNEQKKTFSGTETMSTKKNNIFALRDKNRKKNLSILNGHVKVKGRPCNHIFAVPLTPSFDFLSYYFKLAGDSLFFYLIKNNSFRFNF